MFLIFLTVDLFEEAAISVWSEVAYAGEPRNKC